MSLLQEKHRHVRATGALVLALACVMALAACGRRGDPEAPPSAAVLSTDEQGNVVKEDAPKAPNRPFILDPLLD